MAAVKKIPKEKIIDVACELVKRSGMDALNARALGGELGCSTRPIYLSFCGMDEVKNAVVERMTAVYQSYLKREIDSGVFPLYKACGMGYIKFAREEREYFSYMFMRNRTGERGGPDGGDITAVIDAVVAATGYTREKAERFHFECWIFVHGIAAMANVKYAEFDEPLISKLITDMYTGLKLRFDGLGEDWQ